MFQIVRRNVVGIKVEEREEDHLAAEKEVGNAESDVVVGEGRCRFHGVGGVKDCENNLDSI